MSLETSTPGADRVIQFDIPDVGHFAFRRQTRGDQADERRRYVNRLALTGSPQIAEIVDGDELLWEARLEVGLQPRRLDNRVIDLGETAPDSWFINLPTAENEHRRVLSFDNVPVAHFQAVVDYLEGALAPKKSSAPTNSTASAGAQTNA